MTETSEPERETGPSPAIAEYKGLLNGVLERRPSGTRMRLAQALGKARSFITQITNPAYAAPIPAQHLPTIFEVCHFSTAERRSFMAAYAQAHPRRLVSRIDGSRHRTIHIVVPDLGDGYRNQEFQEMVQGVATSLAKLAQIGGAPRPITPPDHADEDGSLDVAHDDRHDRTADQARSP
jgi:hypothetical protein